MSYSPDIIEITPSRAASLWNHAREAVTQIPDAFQTENGVIEAVRTATEIANSLPNQVLDIGADFQVNGLHKGAIVFRGLTPPDQLTQVVPDEFLPDDPWSQAAGLLAVAFTTAFGPPIQFSTHPRDPALKFVTSIYPRPGFENTDTVSKTGDTGWHTEVGSTPWRPAKTPSSDSNLT